MGKTGTPRLAAERSEGTPVSLGVGVLYNFRMNPNTTVRKAWYQHLYVQVLIGVALGIACGVLVPDFAKELKWLGGAFIALVSMLVAPIVFCTVVHGIASLGDFKQFGRVGWKTLLYFEIVSTLALFIGLAVGNVLRPGDGLNFDPAKVAKKDRDKINELVEKAKAHEAEEAFRTIIPKTIFSPFVEGNLLHTLFVAILAGVAISLLREQGEPIIQMIDLATQVLFGMLNLVVRLAPIGAFGAMAFTVGEFGIKSLLNLAMLMVGFYVTAGLFVVIVLGLIARCAGFSIFRFVYYLRDELWLVLGTSSSESALSSLMVKLERLGCAKTTVRLVVPTGYSFNLDGTSIYLSMAALFLAQATNTPLTFSQQLGLVLIAMLTSKGSAAVTGAGLITLVATITAFPSIPVLSLALLLGIDRFMSECRALTNLIGNGVATVVISRWEGDLSREMLRERLNRMDKPDAQNHV